MPNLTTLQVRNAKPGRHADGNGLYLLVSPSGASSWILRVQRNGKRRDIGLGSTKNVSLLAARQKALEGKRLVNAGKDPRAEWKPNPCANGTFREVALAYHRQTKPSWRNAKHAAQWISTLEKYVFPYLGHRHVDEITATDIYAVLLPIWTEIPETARRVRQRIAIVLDFSVGYGLREHEAPIRALNQLMRGYRQPKPGRFASMPYQALAGFYGALQQRSQTMGRLALSFTILTAARSGEVRGATWEEMNLREAVWQIPGHRMKAGEQHDVPLSAGALSILELAREEAQQASPLVFPGRRGQPLSDMTLSKTLRRCWDGDATVHGFRSAFRNWAAEQAKAPDRLAEAALAHANPNKIEAAYLRTTFFEGRRRLMSDWDRFVRAKP